MIYDYPEYYEATFSFRDIKAEADFLDETIKRYSKIPVRNIFEVACGNAPHAGELTSKSYSYHGLDNNRNMLDYATYKWKDLQPKIHLIEADMKDFRYHIKQDFAYVMLGSLYLNSTEEISSHFDSMNQLLNKGGLYFLDWCIQFGDPLQHNNKNRFVVKKDELEIDSTFNIRLIDEPNQMYEEIWTIHVNDRGRHKNFEMIERNKAILPEEFLQFISERDDFEFAGWWKDWDFGKPIDVYEELVRPMALVRKI